MKVGRRAHGDSDGAWNEGSTADWAFQMLFKQIVDGELAPGERVTEEALCRRIAVSRTPLREAIHRLEMAGLIARQRNRGLRIAEMSMEEMLRLSMLREAIEGLLVRHVAIRYAAGEISLSSLESLVDQMEAIEPDRGFPLLLILGGRFHSELGQLSGDPLAVRLLNQVLLSLERYRHLIDRDPDRARDMAIEHAAIVRAIRSGNSDAACAEMCRHLQNARAAYAKRLSMVPKSAWNVAPERHAGPGPARREAIT